MDVELTSQTEDNSIRKTHVTGCQQLAGQLNYTIFKTHINISRCIFHTDKAVDLHMNIHSHPHVNCAAHLKQELKL